MKYYRKIIHIGAEDSPNVKYARWQQANGVEPTDEKVIAGNILSWSDYQTRLATYDPIRACVGLSGRFYKGPQLLLFPEAWLNHSRQLAVKYNIAKTKRVAKGGGCDPAAGGDDTCFSVVDELGLIELETWNTPDTNTIPGKALAFIRRHNIPPDRFCFDAGGGGKQHADRLRAMGVPVRLVAFGEAIAQKPKRGMRQFNEKVEIKEDKYVYLNRRAEMYYELSQLCDPNGDSGGWAIPGAWAGPQYVELHRQLGPIPRLEDGEGRYYLLQKAKKDAKDTRPTLMELIGCSPDEADAVALGVHGMLHKSQVRAFAGSVG